MQVLVASNDHDVSESCWTDDIWPMSSHQFLVEIARVSVLFLFKRIKLNLRYSTERTQVQWQDKDNNFYINILGR